MAIQAPLTVFLDEAGAVDFGMPVAGEPKKAHVVCAVAIPTIAFKSFHSIIPRNAAGEYLKSSHVDFNKDLALIFVNHLISSNAEVGAFLADTGDLKNVELANRQAKAANDGRSMVRERKVTAEGKHMHPSIGQNDFHYLQFLLKALFACLDVYHSRNGAIPSFVDIVVDTKDIDEFQRQWFVNELRGLFQKHGLVIGELTWKREDEPLLLLPDLFADILCREDRFGDVGAAAHKLWDAEKMGRFKFINKPPTEHSAEAG